MGCTSQLLSGPYYVLPAPPKRIAWDLIKAEQLIAARIDRMGPLRRPAVRAAAAIARAQQQQQPPELQRLNATLDDELSRRPLQLDPAGYFIIWVDREVQEIVADYYTNTINKDGLACDPVTGEVIPCTPGYRRPPSAVFRGRTAKDISVKVLEQQHSLGPVCTHLEHANYLGREFQRAEMALLSGETYVQD